MGLRRWVTGLFTADERGSDGESTDSGPGLSVDVDHRADAIERHYDLPAADAHRLAEILAAEVERPEGYTRTMIADRVIRELDLSEGRARTIVDTEVRSIRTLARVAQFTRQSDGTVSFRWVDSAGRDDSPVCADIRAAIDEDGPVTLERLRELVREAARSHEEGTPERAEDLIPHESCRHTVVRHFAE